MNEREIFAAASLIEDRELRANFLRIVSKSDLELLQRVEALQIAGENAEDLIVPSQRALLSLAEERGSVDSCVQAPDPNQLDSANDRIQPGVL
jgi:hypothetical protein